jgi:hypothetical protein
MRTQNANKRRPNPPQAIPCLEDRGKNRALTGKFVFHAVNAKAESHGHSGSEAHE